MNATPTPEPFLRLMALCRRLLDNSHLAIIAERQDGEREPVIRELVSVLSDPAPSLARSFEGGEAVRGCLYYSLLGVRGLHMLCACLVFEDAIANPDNGSYMSMHSFIPMGIKDAFSVGTEATEAYYAWLADACGRLPIDEDRTNTRSVTAFCRLGLLLMSARRCRNDAEAFTLASVRERAEWDQAYRHSEEDMSKSVFALDDYMSTEKLWKSLFQDTSQSLEDALRDARSQLIPHD